MRTLLIVFAILLFLLICLAAFGGTITYSEPFYETSQVYTAPQYTAPQYTAPQYTAPQYTAPQSEPQFTATQITNPDQQMTAPPLSSMSSSMPPSFEPPSMSSSMPLPPMQATGQMQAMEQFYGKTKKRSSPPKSKYSNEPEEFVNEGFMIEPFEVEQQSMPASY